MNVDIAYEIERLTAFARHSGIIGDRDALWARNTLMGILGVTEPFGGDMPEATDESAAPILANILDWCAANGRIPDDTATSRDLMDARLMGAIMPRPSETAEKFFALKAESPEKATDWFYKLSRDANYIQTARIAKNIEWAAQTPYGDMSVTINLSKPEKDAREIARALEAPATGYPKCCLCAENEGFFGDRANAARQNLRLIPLQLAGERWFLQYSPYVYYNEHCIVLKDAHTPMHVNETTLERLFDFLDMFPHYFIGSNAGLPVVGGSILNHDHYQGGRHVMPMARAGVYKPLRHPGYGGVTAGLLKWPMPVIRLAGGDRREVARLAAMIMEAWEGYSDESADVLAHTNAPHNAVTPIARKNGAGLYELDVVPRNNRATAERPLGLFHPRPALHHIKKENIGLIEVMGLAILPARLERETAIIADILTGKRAQSDISGIESHKDWVDALIAAHGAANSAEAAAAILRADIGRLFTEVLADAGVFKDTEAGRGQFAAFAAACGFEM